jgi:hypothetical protein
MSRSLLIKPLNLMTFHIGPSSFSTSFFHVFVMQFVLCVSVSFVIVLYACFCIIVALSLFFVCCAAFVIGHYGCRISTLKTKNLIIIVHLGFMRVVSRGSAGT